jgi:hypothetical protein
MALAVVASPNSQELNAIEMLPELLQKKKRAHSLPLAI